MDQAHTSSRQLEGLVHEVLSNNRDISNRLRRLETQIGAAAASNSFEASSFIETLDDNMTTRSLIEDRARNQTINQTLTYGFTFDEVLQALECMLEPRRDSPVSPFHLPHDQLAGRFSRVLVLQKYRIFPWSLCR